MLENVRFYSFLSKKNIATLLNLIFLLFVYSIAQGSEKIKIINNFNTLNTLKFDFTQKSFDNEENGVCYLKRPYFFKCLYIILPFFNPKKIIKSSFDNFFILFNDLNFFKSLNIVLLPT